MRPFQPALRIALSIASMWSQPCSGATSGRYVAERVRRGARDAAEDSGDGDEEDEEDEEREEGEDEEREEEREESGRVRSETAEESGEGASEAEGLVDGGEKDIWMPCVPSVQSRYEAASSKSVRSDILARHTRGAATHTHIPPKTMVHVSVGESKRIQRERKRGRVRVLRGEVVVGSEEKRDAPAFERGQVVQLDPAKPMIPKRAHERILLEARAERLRVERANAPSQAQAATTASRTRIPRDKKRAGTTKKQSPHDQKEEKIKQKIR
jgi:hypothetical protein